MLKSFLCDYSEAYILVKGTITITGHGDDAAVRLQDQRKKEIIFKNCTTFRKCITEINNRQINNVKDIDIVM